jgi:hypothetical protein
MASADKRIIDLIESQTLTQTMYLAADSEDGGTVKIPISLFSGYTDQVLWGGIGGSLSQQTDLNAALNNIMESTILVDENGAFYVQVEEN